MQEDSSGRVRGEKGAAAIRLGKAAIYLVLLILAVTTLFPFYWAIGTSLKTEQQAIASHIQL